MTQERLIQTVISIIIMAGYNVSERYGMRPRCFDLVAGKNGVILVIKVVPHIDSVTEGSARDLSIIARYLGGKPLIVGEKARDTDLERVLYTSAMVSLPPVQRHCMTILWKRFPLLYTPTRVVFMLISMAISCIRSVSATRCRWVTLHIFLAYPAALSVSMKAG